MNAMNINGLAAQKNMQLMDLQSPLNFFWGVSYIDHLEIMFSFLVVQRVNRIVTRQGEGGEEHHHGDHSHGTTGGETLDSVVLEDGSNPMTGESTSGVGLKDPRDVVQNVTSPMATEMDMSDAEIILDSPVKDCYCEKIQCPDRQPSIEDWDVCHHCKDARHPTMDDMETEVDYLGTMGDDTRMHFPSPGKHVPETEDMGEISPVPAPARKLRRLRPVIVEPVMVDSPTHDVDETGDMFSQLSLHEVGQPEMSQVSWFTASHTWFCFPRSI